ncbi:MAG: Fe3+/spermidine/putrescine ABC transporter ATP-binding protein [Devosia sp. 67-54]|uniref:ABC transporter ATP-binding protein n=1 Tax=unclassified Devosia TaxID=196773 RepID=UPI00095B5B25|nr:MULTISPECIES: ABC transporter ATP-binding protein [unclassified Devosia]MBN9306988.1 ABC transporter ATP-binding protein [Devosia sp.]OJX16925.1 MAG: Fe3+/spermidine/putrescine ABC transporter ATP-binding protein [Devosia sp. 67-54]
MAFLKLESLRKAYGEFVAVKECSLSIGEGEFVCLLGPSGCGKTTTLQMIAGFVEPTEGRIILNGADITRLGPSKRGLGIVFQSYALFPHMTVAANVAFGLEMRAIAKRERRERVAHMLDLVRLDGFADRYPRQLSGGQRQRVALARALVIEPSVLLLDEPMGALDALLREEMQIELRALQKRLGITTIMVTHDQVEAMSLADRVVLLNNGSVEQVAEPFAMYEHPSGRFASTFLGKSNVLAGDVSGASVLVGDQELPADLAGMSGAVDYIIRPEKITFAAAGGLVRGQVTARVFLGDRWLYQLDTPVGPMQVIDTNVGLPKAVEGDAVGLVWAAENARVVARGAAS